MPSHITHEVFVCEVFKRAFGTEEVTPFHVFGAQGADFFFHNHRTEPTALIFGRLLHSEGYGRFVGHLINYGRERKIPFDSPFGAFTAAFATHPVLDRITNAVIKTYPDYSDSDNVRRRIQNAYHDTRRYYSYTNPPDRQKIRTAEKDR